MRIVATLAVLLATVLAVAGLTPADAHAATLPTATHAAAPKPPVVATLYAPDHDAAGEPTCTSHKRATLFDTENPELGDHGVVCLAVHKAKTAKATPAAPAPAVAPCPAGQAMAEDGTCVPANYWG